MPDLKSTLVVPQPHDNLELDEVWSFVRRKKKRAWVWIALSFQSRQVVAMVVGDRSARQDMAHVVGALAPSVPQVDHLHRLPQSVLSRGSARAAPAQQEGERLDKRGCLRQRGGAFQLDLAPASRAHGAKDALVFQVVDHAPFVFTPVRGHLQPLLFDTLQDRRPDTPNNLDGTMTREPWAEAYAEGC